MGDIELLIGTLLSLSPSQLCMEASRALDCCSEKCLVEITEENIDLCFPDQSQVTDFKTMLLQ